MIIDFTLFCSLTTIKIVVFVGYFCLLFVETINGDEPNMLKNLNFFVDISNGEIDQQQFEYLTTIDTARLCFLIKNYVYSNGDKWSLDFKCMDGSLFEYTDGITLNAQNQIIFVIPDEVIKHQGILTVQLVLTSNNGVDDDGKQLYQTVATLVSSINVIKSIRDQLGGQNQIEISVENFEDFKNKLEQQYGKLADIIQASEDAINKYLNQSLSDPTKLPFVSKLSSDVNEIKNSIAKLQLQLDKKENGWTQTGNIFTVFSDLPPYIPQNALYKIINIDDTNTLNEVKPINQPNVMFTKINDGQWFQSGLLHL